MSFDNAFEAEKNKLEWMLKTRPFERSTQPIGTPKVNLLATQPPPTQEKCSKRLVESMVFAMVCRSIEKSAFGANRRSKKLLQLSTVQTMYRLPPSLPTRPKHIHKMVDCLKFSCKHALLQSNNGTFFGQRSL